MKKIIYGMVAAVLAVLFLTQCQQGNQEKKAKYVFYFIGDGMGVNQVNGAEMFLAEQEGRIGIVPFNFTQFPVVNHATTYSKYNSVTCSAAAGTALATGTKTKNGTIGMDSLRQNPLYSVAVRAQKAGKKVGITTSVSVDHATPAAFYAHQPDRNMCYDIATDLPKTAFEFYAGSGFLQEKNKKNPEAASVLEIIQDSGYVIARGVDEFLIKTKETDKMLLMPKVGKSTKSLSYAIDRQEDDLTLAQITSSAIEFLSKKEQDGFFLMVEGGKIDWACHSNDAATVFHEIIDFSAAIQEALNFYQKHPDETLIVVTADHETGGMALGNGPYALNLKVLQFQQMSIEKLTTEIKELRKAKNNQVVWEDIESLLAKTVGFGSQVKLTEKQLQKLKETYKSSFIGDQVVLEKNLYASNEPVAGQAIRILSEIAGIAWASGGHSAGLVPVYAIGAGASLFQGKLDNTDIPRKIAEAAGY